MQISINKSHKERWFTSQTVLTLLSRETNQTDVQGMYHDMAEFVNVLKFLRKKPKNSETVQGMTQLLVTSTSNSQPLSLITYQYQLCPVVYRILQTFLLTVLLSNSLRSSESNPELYYVKLAGFLRRIRKKRKVDTVVMLNR